MMVLLEHNPVTIRGRSVLPVFKEMKESTSILRREMENIKKRPNKRLEVNNIWDEIYSRWD